MGCFEYMLAVIFILVAVVNEGKNMFMVLISLVPSQALNL